MSNLQEISTTNNVKNPPLAITGLDLAAKLELNYNNTENTKFPNDQLEMVNGEPYGSEQSHEPFLSEPDGYFGSLQFTEWNEEDHPRDEKGRWAKKGSTGSPEEDITKTPDITLQYNSKKLKERGAYYRAKSKEYAAYNQQRGNHKKYEPLVLTDQPSGEHYATAYSVLKKYPHLDEKTMIQAAWEADKLRDVHERIQKDVLSRLTKEVQSRIPNAKVAGRVKTRYSMLEKMGRKGKYKSVSELGDISGYRIIANSIDELNKANKIASDTLTLTNPDDLITNPKVGYRALHADVIFTNNLRGELQMKTPNQDMWARFFHDSLYKIDETTLKGKMIKENMGVLEEYSFKMSDYYYELDKGNTTAIKPDCPEEARRLIGCL